MTEQFSNFAQTTLAAAITDTVSTSITVSSSTSFPSSANFRIVIDSEIMLVTAGAGTTTWTVTRGAESTTAATHVLGAPVTHILTAGAISQYRTDTAAAIGLTGTTASLPAAGTAGRLYYPTDGKFVYQDNGTTWQPWGPIYPCSPPVDANFSWVNQGSASVSSTNGGVTLTAPSNGNTDSVRTRVASSPAAPYSVTIGFNTMILAGSGAGVCGLLLRESSTGKMTALFYGDAGGGGKGAFYNVYNLSSPTSFSGSLASYQSEAQAPIWLRIHDDGTNLTYYIGCSPYDFIQLYSQARTAAFTTAPNQYGFGMDPYGGSAGAIMSVFHLLAG